MSPTSIGNTELFKVAAVHKYTGSHSSVLHDQGTHQAFKTLEDSWTMRDAEECYMSLTRGELLRK